MRLLAVLITSLFAQQATAQQIKVIAFDTFGTVYDLAAVDRDEVRDYIAQVRRPRWSPLNLPSSWQHMPPHADSVEGIKRLRERYIVVTLSNGPLGLQTRMAKNAGIVWDAIIPLEIRRVYKPDPLAYQLVCDVFGVEPGEVLMVTGNAGSPDIAGAESIGMKAQMIRQPGTPQTITELADLLIPPETRSEPISD